MTFDDTSKTMMSLCFLLFLASSPTVWCMVELNASDVVIAEGVDVEEVLCVFNCAYP